MHFLCKTSAFLDLDHGVLRKRWAWSMGAFDAQGGVVWRVAGSVITKAYWFGDFLDLKMVDSKRGTIVLWRNGFSRSITLKFRFLWFWFKALLVGFFPAKALPCCFNPDLRQGAWVVTLPRQSYLHDTVTTWWPWHRKLSQGHQHWEQQPFYLPALRTLWDA